jgi:hypothetical protein
MKLISAEEWQWRGTTGHSMFGQRCLFKLHTKIGGYRISTIGLIPVQTTKDTDIPFLELESGYHIETVVFNDSDLNTRYASDGMNLSVFNGNAMKSFEPANAMHLKWCWLAAKGEL